MRMQPTIILPANFKHPRYIGGAWLNQRLHWSDEDLTLLTAAADLEISPNIAANSLGRAPSTLVHQAYARGIWVPRSWRAFLPKKSKAGAKLLDLNYPYIVKPDERHADLIAVNRMVSRELPGREDVCQDIMLALWDSRTSLEELRHDPRAVKAFVRAFRKASFERSGYGVESMDVTLHSDDGDGKSKYEDERYQRELVDSDDQFIEKMMFGKRYSGDRGFSAVADEEEKSGIPAAFWMRAEMV